MSLKGIAPNGAPITSSYEVIHGYALIYGFECKSDGSIEIEYAGETDVDWDSQKTVTEQVDGKAQRIFVDEIGQHWTENQITFVEDKGDDK